MKVRFKKIIFTCFVGMISLNTFAQASLQAPYTEQAVQALSDIDTLAETALDLFEVPGAAVGVVVDGEIVLAKGYGLRDQNRGLPVTENTLFAIGSCTKAFVTFVLGTLVDDGTIHWDDTVISHLPEFLLWDHHATHHLTIKDLVSHRSGLPRHDAVWYNSPLSMEEILPLLQYLEPACDLREKFYYNNLMYGVAGLLIERATGKSWEDNVRERIFHPSGMEGSNFSVLDSQLSEDHSKPHEVRNGRIKEIPFRNICNIGSAGAINSTISDMLKWVQLHVTEQQLISPETLEEMHTLCTPTTILASEKFISLGYGLGWFIGIYDGHYVVEHGGGIDGFISRVVYLPHEKAGFVILSNSSTGGGFIVRALGNATLDRLLDSEKIDWLTNIYKLYELFKANQVEHNDSAEPLLHPLEDYVGVYEHPAYGTVKVYREKETLFASFNRMTAPLIHKGDDLFIASENTDEPIFAQFPITFETDASGKIYRLQIPFEPTVNPILFMKK